jgi:hypothetical protein
MTGVVEFSGSDGMRSAIMILELDVSMLVSWYSESCRVEVLYEGSKRMFGRDFVYDIVRVLLVRYVFLVTK